MVFCFNNTVIVQPSCIINPSARLCLLMRRYFRIMRVYKVKNYLIVIKILRSPPTVSPNALKHPEDSRRMLFGPYSKAKNVMQKLPVYQLCRLKTHLRRNSIVLNTALKIICIHRANQLKREGTLPLFFQCSFLNVCALLRTISILCPLPVHSAAHICRKCPEQSFPNLYRLSRIIANTVKFFPAYLI